MNETESRISYPISFGVLVVLACWGATYVVLVQRSALLELGPTDFIVFAATLFFTLYVPLCYVHKKITFGPEEVRLHNRCAAAGLCFWDGSKKIDLKNVYQIDGLFGPAPPTWIVIHGWGSESGRTVECAIKIPTSPIPWIWEGLRGTDEAVSTICANVPAAKIHPKVVRYLQRRGAHDPERHPSPDECGEALETV